MATRALFDTSFSGTRRPELGLAANWPQFVQLVVVNAFVGAMVGLERAVLPMIASSEFHVTSATAILAFVASFGLAKAAANLLSGWIADRRARRPALLLGWVIALPVPLLVLGARNWWWIVAANALLGVSQGLTWSMTVLMKIDLLGPRRRGFAMGINEFAGYLALAGAGLLSAWLAGPVGLRQGAAYPGLAIATIGLLLSLGVGDTTAHARMEGQRIPSSRETMWSILRRSAWRDRNLFSVCQAGLVNNLNDGVVWGLLPLVFAAEGVGLRETGALVALYPAVWGVAQLVAGPLSDRVGRKRPIVAGMLLQGVALVTIATIGGAEARLISLVLLGIGTALVYPTLLAAVGDMAHPSSRGMAVGAYRLWRDLGYVAGALLGGVLADIAGRAAAIAFVGLLTAISGVIVARRMKMTHPEE